MFIKNKVFKNFVAVLTSVLISFSYLTPVFAVSKDVQSKGAVSGNIASINQDYIDYLNNGKKFNGIKPSPLDLSYLANSASINNKASFRDFPESYDLRDYGLVTPVPDQGNYGTCWSFGALGSAESSLMKKQFANVLLSEKHLIMFSKSGNDESEFFNTLYGIKNPYDGGASLITPVACMSAWKGPIDYSKLPYKPEEETDEALRFLSDYHLQDCVNIYAPMCQNEDPLETPTSINVIKGLIMDNGAYEISYLSEYSSSEYYNNKTFAIYHDEEISFDHSNLIVGWDDNYKKENFNEKHQPKNNGAWLIRNSWGLSFGDNGYFWISYEDKSINVIGSSYNFENKDNYENNYQYDINGWVMSASADDFIDDDKASKTAYISNIFTSKGKEMLEAVSFYTTDMGTDYDISVYTNVDNDNPTSGRLVYSNQTGTEEYSGYHTIELDKPVRLEKGVKFSVVVKLINQEYPYPMALEGTILEPNSEPEYMGNGGESYYSNDGKEWTDIVKLGKHALNFYNATIDNLYTSNVCLKAFTNPLPSSEVAIGNVDFSLLDGEVALGSYLELSGASNIHYIISPIDEKSSKSVLYTKPIKITESCTITAWGEENGKEGNRVSKTYIEQKSQLTDLMLKDLNTENISQIDFNDIEQIKNVGVNTDTIQLYLCSKDIITVNGEVVGSNRWSFDIPLEKGKVNEIKIETKGDGKLPSNYALKIYRAPIDYDYTKETIMFDEENYTVTDSDNNFLHNNQLITKYISLVGEEQNILTITEKKTNKQYNLPVVQRAEIYNPSIDFDAGVLNALISTKTLISYNEDMSDAFYGEDDYLLLEAGRNVYLKRPATAYSFATPILKIEVPNNKPKAPKVETEVGADYIKVKEIENAEYRISSDDEWQDDNLFSYLEPDTEYNLEVRIKSAENSFASDVSSLKVTTKKGALIYVNYVAFGNTVLIMPRYLEKGVNTVYSHESLEDAGYTLKNQNDLNGKKVTVTDIDGVLTPDVSEIEYELTADINPSDYTYKLNYWSEDGKIIDSKIEKFTHTEDIVIDEYAVPFGYKAVGYVKINRDFATRLSFYNNKWSVIGKEVDLIIKKIPTTTIQIAHTNDIHGFYTETKNGVIGYAKLKGLIDNVGADLVLDSGDTYHGQAVATIEEGRSIAELMKEAGYDAVTLGNNDWSYGAERLLELEKIGGFPILTANVTDENGNDFFKNQYIIKDVIADDGTTLKVGVFGVIDSSFYSSMPSENVKGLKFDKETETATRIANTLKNEKNCDIVIALTHNKDLKAFVKNISNVDAVIGGHQHILIDEKYNDKDGKSVAVVESGCYFNNIGVLSLTFDTNKKTVTRVEEKNYTLNDLTDIEANSDVNAKIKEIEERENDTLNKVVGQSKGDYLYSRENLRISEQKIGRIVTQAYLDKTGADVAFENAGGIRGGIHLGDVTYKDIINISPYGNTIVTKQLTGKQILDILEYSLEINYQCDKIYTLQKQAILDGNDPYQYTWPTNNSSALQFGGIKVKYDMTKPSGSRVVSAFIKDKAVDLNKLYTVATNDYVANKTDLMGIGELPIVKEYGTCEQALLSFIEKGTFDVVAETENLSIYKSQETVTPELKPTVDNSEDINKDTNENTNDFNSPKTGEQSNVLIFNILLVLSLSGLVVLSKSKKSDYFKK